MCFNYSSLFFQNLFFFSHFGKGCICRLVGFFMVRFSGWEKVLKQIRRVWFPLVESWLFDYWCFYILNDYVFLLFFFLILFLCYRSCGHELECVMFCCRARVSGGSRTKQHTAEVWRMRWGCEATTVCFFFFTAYFFSYLLFFLMLLTYDSNSI